jgi:protein-disulfide isomerase
MPPEACAAGLKDVDFSAKKLSAAQKSCDELVQKLCDAVGPDTQSCQLVTTETKKFPPEKCKMMLEHLPEVTAELQKMEEANKPLSPELQAAISQGGGVSFGPANAKVQVVEFSDFQCPYCSRAAGVVHQIKEKYGDRVRFTFRQFPLPMHPNARMASEAALAANSQGKFWEYHDRLFKNQSQLDRAGLEEQAKQTGLNMPAFKKSLDEHKYAATVDADVQLGEKVQVSGTPSMFINGERVANPTSFEAVAEMIESALKGQGPTPG